MNKATNKRNFYPYNSQNAKNDSRSISNSTSYLSKIAPQYLTTFDKTGTSFLAILTKFLKQALFIGILKIRINL